MANLKKTQPRDHHLFVTDHPYFINLGLGVFTTGTLMQWWNEQAANNGPFLNRKVINKQVVDGEKFDKPDNGILELLGITDTTEFFWYGWKPSETAVNDGVYKKQNLYGLEENAGGSSSDAWEYKPLNKTGSAYTLLDTNMNDPKITGPTIIGGTLDPDEYQSFRSIVHGEVCSSANFGPLYALIQLNRYMNAFSEWYPRSLWDPVGTGVETHPPLSKDIVFSNHELLTEIKAGKSGPFLEWTGNVTVFTGQNDSAIDCGPVTEDVQFKLFLYDEAQGAKGNQTLVLRNFQYSGPPTDVVTGERVKQLSDGDKAEAVGGNSDDKVAPLSVNINRMTGKWESGTPQLFAIVTSAIPNAPPRPSVDDIKEQDTKEIFESLVSENKILMSTGEVMPIRLQNGNPLQWSPNYVSSKEKRCIDGDKTKETVIAYNVARNKSYAVGDDVFIQKVDGIWLVSDPGRGASGIVDGGPVTPGVGKWGEFTYMMTNAQFYFVDSNKNSISPRIIEQAFHRNYYAFTSDSLNGAYEGIDYGLDGGYDPTNTFSTVGLELPEAAGRTIRHGYLQVTSFDSLDSQIYGIRGKDGVQADKCAIATTQGDITSSNVNIQHDPGEHYPWRNNAHSALFFGCVFPGGYLGTNDYITPGRDWTVKATGYDGLVGFIDPSDYFTSEETPANFPFAPGDGITSRNNCRAAYTGGDTSPFASFNSDDNDWIRFNGRTDSVAGPNAGANLFAAQRPEAQTITTTMEHVPADVMLNASPSGVNGSPLYSVHRFKSLMDVNNGNVPLDAQGAFFESAWLGKEGDNNTTIDSAFDFTPKRPGQIIFRPLKLEAYLQFGDKQINKLRTYVNDVSDQVGKNWHVFTAEAHKTQLDGWRPVSHTVDARESTQFDPALAQWYSRDGILLHASDQYGLVWGGGIDEIDKNRYRGYQYLHARRFWNSEQTSQPNTTNALEWAGPATIFYDMRSGWGVNDTNSGGGAAAFGVITSFVTITANDSLKFQTNNRIGMGMELRYTPGTSNGSFERYDQSASWGTSNLSDSYRTKNIIDLSVRVFHNHPREQTLFDPRTFAVHHFNPAIQFVDEKYFDPTVGARIAIPLKYTDLAGNTQPFADDETWFRNAEITNFSSFRDVDNSFLSFNYFSPIPSASTDFQEPTRWAKHIDNTFTDNPAELHMNGVDYYPTGVELNTVVFNNATRTGTDPFEPPIMGQKYWSLNPVRTGKLLPYRYIKKTITTPTRVDWPVGIKEITDDDPRLASDAELFNKLIFVSPEDSLFPRGAGFVPNDTVGNEDYSVLLKVVTTDVVGGITAVECLDPGRDIPASIFAPTGALAADLGGKGLRLETINSAAGGGLNAYFLTGVVTADTIQTDPKPRLVLGPISTEINRVCGLLAHPQGGNGQNAEFENNAFDVGSNEVVYIIDGDDISSNKQYDAFFHFHNDISFNWLAGGQSVGRGFNGFPHGDLRNPTECSEQWVELNISST